MNNQIFRIKKDDTFPPLKIQIKEKDYLGSETGINLSALTSVTFSMVGSCDENKIYNENATIVCREDGVVQYDWSVGDTDTADTFYGEFKFYFSGYSKPTQFSVPSFNGIKIDVFDNLKNV
ncbi:MAG: hypothetical protein PHE30_04865 [Candidatus Omnitrophica bacterium]|nr:hypothetical protein [Candidatus Omnitrophota bacterium]